MDDNDPATTRPKQLPPEEQHYLLRLGERVRELRNEQNIGLEELAASAGIHRTHLWKIEKGRINTSVLNLFRLARTLQVKPSDFLVDL